VDEERLDSEHNIPIEMGSLVSLHFSLALNNGELIDSNFASTPASFRLGDGSMLPGFENVLLGLRAGSEIATRLLPEQAFGEINSNNQHRFPIAKFKVLLEDDLLPTKVGSVVSFKDAGGFDLPGIVSSIFDEFIEVDFNHPLAGKEILFKAAIVSVMAPDVDTLELKL
jgi:FKBP-type peptidyl-prolyl cis-trans isomerase SlpA